MVIDRRPIIQVVAVLALLVALACAASLTGCADILAGSSSSAETSVAKPRATTTTEMFSAAGSATTDAPTTTIPYAPSFGQSAEAWGVKVTVSAPEVVASSYSSSYYDPRFPPDYGLTLVFVTILNSGDRDWTYSYKEFRCYGEGPGSSFIAVEVDDWLASGTLSPGQEARGWVGFALPEGTYVTSVTYLPARNLSPSWIEWD